SSKSDASVIVVGQLQSHRAEKKLVPRASRESFMRPIQSSWIWLCAACGVVSKAITKLQPPPLMPLPGIEFIVVSHAVDTVPRSFCAQLPPKRLPRSETFAVSPVTG